MKLKWMYGIRHKYMQPGAFLWIFRHQSVADIRLSIYTDTSPGFCRPQTNFSWTFKLHSAHFNVEFISQLLYNMISMCNQMVTSEIRE